MTFEAVCGVVWVDISVSIADTLGILIKDFSLFLAS